MMKAYEIYCGGEFIATPDSIEVINPYTRQPFARTWRATEKDLDRAIDAAQGARQAMKDMPSWRRSQALGHIADELERSLEDFAELLSMESAKPVRYARAEVQRAVQSFRVASEETRRHPNEYLSLDWTPAGEGKEGMVKYFPVGLVAGISPFNFPLNLAVHKIAPAIASGCPIVLKPSSSTPLSTLALARIIHEAGLPAGAVSILPMDRQTGNLLVTDDRFQLLTFTGSPGVGWKMKARAGKKKVVLELGGNAGVIVAGSADLDLAVAKCLVGGFAYSGQVCIHAQRIYVQENVFEAFSAKFVEGAGKLRNGDPLDPATEISSMIDEENARRVEEWVAEAVDEGAKVLTGGSRKGAFHEPTVLSQTRPSMKVCSLEVFGPVVTLEPYRKFEEALHQINDSRYGLQAGVFTNRLDEMNSAFHQLDVGGVIINDVPTFRVDHMPYGGIKDSGLGREGIRYAMTEMLEPRILVRNIR